MMDFGVLHGNKAVKLIIPKNETDVSTFYIMLKCHENLQ